MKDRGGRLLVFASRHVGTECVRFLLQNEEPIACILFGAESDLELRAIAEQAGLRCRPFSREALEELVTEGGQFSWLLNLWSPHLVPVEILNLARHRLNIHPSLAPIARGNDNAAWCIRKSLRAGVSLLEMTPKIDEGGIYAQREIPTPFPVSGSVLHAELQAEAVRLFIEKWPSIAEGEISPRPQQGEVTYFTRRMTNLDKERESQENMTLEEWVRWALAHDFYPNTTAVMKFGNRKFRVRVEVQELEPNE